MLIYSSQTLRLKLFGSKAENTAPSSLDRDDDSEAFEPLSPDKEVVISVKNLNHTYHLGMTNCCGDKSKQPVEVLKGLSMEVCRGEVYGFLGHNGAGKVS